MLLAQIRVVLDSVVMGSVSKAHGERASLPGASGVVSPLSLFRLSSTQTGALEITMKTWARGRGDGGSAGSSSGPACGTVHLELISAQLDVQVWVCRWFQRVKQAAY